MATIVSTGQITIVDNNDAKPVSLLIAANSPQQQVYTKNDTSVTYTPNYYTTNLVLTPKIYLGGIGSASDVSSNTAIITNRKWGKTAGGGELYSAGAATQDSTNFVQTDGTTAVASPFVFSANGTTLTIAGNLKSATVSYPVYFEADYTDTTTGLTSHIITSTELSVVNTGTNAVFVQFKGTFSVENNPLGGAGNSNSIPITADLVRSSGVDRGSLTYKWYNITSGTAVQVSTSSTLGYYAIGDTATGATPTVATINANLPAVGGVNTYVANGTGNGNTLTVNENAITDLALFRVDITDTVENKTYSGYFTVYDYADPYTVLVYSSSGDKLQNGIGSTNLTPVVYSGDLLVSSLANYTFNWVFYDRNGKRAAFVDSSSNYYGALGVGIPISNNTTSTITHDTVTSALQLGTNNIVKVVKDGVAYYYEVASASTNVVTLKTTGLSVLSLTDYPLPAAGSLANGVIYACTLNGIRSTTNSTAIVVTGFDIDAKGRITCEASRA